MNLLVEHKWILSEQNRLKFVQNQSSKNIENQNLLFKKYIQALKDNPEQGDIYPGFGEVNVRKIRIGLPEYSISSRKGLRLIFFYSWEKRVIIPLHIYKKGKYEENTVLRKIKKALKDILKEL